jgi:hypothetical protein
MTTSNVTHFVDISGPRQSVDRLESKHVDGKEPGHAPERANGESVKCLKPTAGLNPDDYHGESTTNAEEMSL